MVDRVKSGMMVGVLATVVAVRIVLEMKPRSRS